MMQQIIYAVFLSVIVVTTVIADDASVFVLQNRLKKINNLYVHFIQKVINSDNDMVLECRGELWIKRPNLFNWHMISPEENFLISDGKTLWFYIPSIKQVTAYRLRNFSDNIFFMLFSSNNIYEWNEYTVSQQGDFFYLIPISNNFNLKECRIKITDRGTIEKFSFFEEKGQHVDYYLLDQNNNDIDIGKFYFIPSKDIQLDDQRK
ncbi:outer membrane lipoprotein chaperone LolA [Blochmannia endosymbiont of Camponotus sp.]|uniref:outer membrane lipoprotein chaperone LolA n=1 Tax=Blochmannia endosymbiont of Camponotus sp. TaxID=700220 RepID=UPI002024D492|nr:outer membrane lipoprotein chaperone LolA [Blochmannia endosymbiont of Camponotus sp.]URJ25524.1 outer membrane lipoprotein chaperone LolA [Blochmannia endosymbiont of Camponotus sp.]